MTKARTQLEERICPECGKSFIFRDHWAYKLIIDHKVVNYCSWTCKRKNEKGKKDGREGEDRADHQKGGTVPGRRDLLQH